MEKGQVDYVPVAAPSRKVAGHSRHLSSPGKGKKKVFWSPVNLLRQFEVSSPPASSRKRTVVDDASFASALASESPQGKPRKVGEIEKLRQSFEQDCHHCYCLFGP